MKRVLLTYYFAWLTIHRGKKNVSKDTPLWFFALSNVFITLFFAVLCLFSVAWKAGILNPIFKQKIGFLSSAFLMWYLLYLVIFKYYKVRKDTEAIKYDIIITKRTKVITYVIYILTPIVAIALSTYLSPLDE